MTALARPALQRLPLAASVIGLAALACALLLGPTASPVPSAALGALAAAILLAELMRRTRELLRTGLGFYLALAVLGASVAGAAWAVVVAAGFEFIGLRFVLSSALGLGGSALVILALLRLRDEAGTGQTPWQALTGGPTAVAGARARFGRAAPLLAGVLAILVAARIFVIGLRDTINGGPSDTTWITGLVVLAIIIGGPAWALRSVVIRLRARDAEQPVARDERVVAAHLHDSVLQTLSMIQRDPDPVRMQQLARQQERSLRAWLAGREETVAASLAAAVRLAAHAVEDEAPGVVIEVVMVGDAPLDAAADAMVQAGREAMRNAARHAGGQVRVFLEVEDGGGRRLVVRDTGPGFDLDAVAGERRGVRDAIIGRMEQVGGSAAFESGPSGTEIALRFIPAPPGLLE